MASSPHPWRFWLALGRLIQLVSLIHIGKTSQTVSTGYRFKSCQMTIQKSYLTVYLIRMDPAKNQEWFSRWVWFVHKDFSSIPPTPHTQTPWFLPERFNNTIKVEVNGGFFNISFSCREQEHFVTPSPFYWVRTPSDTHTWRRCSRFFPQVQEIPMFWTY